MANLLRSMGVHEYEPRVVTQLLELVHRFTAKVVRDAQDLADFAEKPSVDEDDLALAVREHLTRNHASPPCQSELRDLADRRNAQPLPPMPAHVFGVHLPEGGSGSLAVSNFEREQQQQPPLPHHHRGMADAWGKAAAVGNSAAGAAMVDGKVAVMDIKGGAGGQNKRKAAALGTAAGFVAE